MGCSDRDDNMEQRVAWRREEDERRRKHKTQRFEGKLVQSEFVAALLKRIKNLEDRLPIDDKKTN